MAGAEFPYSVGPEDKPISFHMNVQDQISMYKDNERHQKAPPILPFELERMNEILGNTFVSLAELRNMLVRVASKQPEQDSPTDLPQEEISKAVLDNLTSKIDKINELILDFPEDLSKIAI